MALLGSQIERLEKLQRRAIRIILGYPYHTQPLTVHDYLELNLDHLVVRRNFATACYGFKWLHNLLPRMLIRIKSKEKETETYLRRRVLVLPDVVYPTSRKYDRSPLIYLVKLLNCLPMTVINSGSMDGFKSNRATCRNTLYTLRF